MKFILVNHTLKMDPKERFSAQECLTGGLIGSGLSPVFSFVEGEYRKGDAMPPELDAEDWTLDADGRNGPEEEQPTITGSPQNRADDNNEAQNSVNQPQTGGQYVLKHINHRLPRFDAGKGSADKKVQDARSPSTPKAVYSNRGTGNDITAQKRVADTETPPTSLSSGREHKRQKTSASEFVATKRAEEKPE